ncbi:MAG: copper resistance protein B [Nitrospirales bacterium]|nr:MAG: copper resistance protein B [Nitrospirales bacterium]
MSAPIRTVLLLALLSFLSVGLDAVVASAQTIPLASTSLGIPTHTTPTMYAEMQPGTPSGASTDKAETFPHVSPPLDWPSPVDDEQNHFFFLADVLEYRPKTGGSGSGNDYRWDIEGWYGGDYNRLWFKSEGQQNSAFKADYDVDSQLLYGRFFQQYYDFQVGGRLETQSFEDRNVTRGLAVIGLQGLVPYNYEVESALFVSHRGHVSARLTGTKDLFLSQRLILQLRFETNAAIQRVKKFTTGSGLNNVEGGARLRYEIRREFAPYVGVSLDRSFGETATLVRQEDGDTSQIRFVVGVRLWF